jgi:phosphate transport system substrate-binding protein
VPVQARTTHLIETGSTLLYPLFNLWVPTYTATHPGIRITTEATGSGTGIAQAVAGLVQFGASDAYLSPTLQRLHPGLLNIPLAISSQMVNYNLPGLNRRSLRLSGPVLAAIYAGRIRDWNAPAIRALNPGLPLPHHRILPIHRSDGSGDTFIFTQYLSFSTPVWMNATGYGTTVSWPAIRGEIGATGNPGMVQALATNPYAIAYIGVSYRSAILKDHLGQAQLENRAGRFVPLTGSTVAAAVAARAPHTPPDQSISLVFAPGANAYPIINYEYVIVKEHQPSRRMALAIRRFLEWAIAPTGGNAPSFLNRVGFAPLPAQAIRQSRRQIVKIH